MIDLPALARETAEKLREELAELCHTQWSGWMKHLFSKSSYPDPRGAIIPGNLTERWLRQMNTPYAELSDEEKDSDRAEADRFLAILQQALTAHTANIEQIQREYWGKGYARGQTETCRSCHQCSGALDKESPNGGLRCSECDEADLEHEAAEASLIQLQQEKDESLQWLMSFAQGTPMPNGEYAHMVHCSGSRAHPAGTRGVTCSCQPRLKEAEHRLTQLTPYLQHKAKCATISLGFRRDDLGFNVMQFPDANTICTCGLADLLPSPGGQP